ncbi:MAG: hypothetical protein A2X12_10725 [Bacteroidetes bacterium GWE2_29_8]|nr:MAG: hypothetical protein A2X12_10725 [Bacteroidetes bacterium GWE2_29_8]OFY24834.1 MAG: hypothetical protein A2X02_03800 [Bacteroidetes bacterium GWF2_29_10]
MKKNLFYLLLLILVFGCNSDNQTNESENFDQIAEKSKKVQVAKEEVVRLLKSFPSPLEITSLIKQSGAGYDEDILNNVNKVSSYNTSFNKALNLGIYGADLGYVNIYEKSFSAMKYLEVVKSLADDLKVGHFFDFNTLKRLASNNKNIDSLIYISTSSFEKMNNYLSDQNRGNVSTLILVGGWLEGLYISTQMVKKTNNKDLIERIGEQKVALNDIYILLAIYKNEPNFAKLVSHFEDLKETYKNINITYEYAEPTTKEVDGMLIIEDNTRSSVNINDQQLQTIINKISEIRAEIVNTK